MMHERELANASLEELERRENELKNELQELPSQLEQARQELFNLRFRLATRQLPDTSQVRRAKRQIARLMTKESEIKQEWAYIQDLRRIRKSQ